MTGLGSGYLQDWGPHWVQLWLTCRNLWLALFLLQAILAALLGGGPSGHLPQTSPVPRGAYCFGAVSASIA